MRVALLLLVGLVLGGCNAALGIEEVKLGKGKQKGTSETKRNSGNDDKGDGKDDQGDRPVAGQDDETPGSTTGGPTGTGTKEGAAQECNGAVDCKRLVFVTRAKFTGNLGGIAGADQKCFEAAKKIPGYSGRAFRAWLSDSLSAAKDRLPKGTSAYVRTDKSTVATAFGDLTDGDLNLPLALDEDGKPLEDSSFERTVWTGTTIAGEASELTCSDWVSETVMQSGTFGDSTTTDNTWSDSASSSCNAERHLYCIEY